MISCIETEHRFAAILDGAMRRGWCFDMAAAEKLVTLLMERRAELDSQVSDYFPPRQVVYYTPKKKLRREKTEVFNPNSRPQIEARLKEVHGWEPFEFTPTGRAKIDEDILGELDYPEAKFLTERLMVQRRLGQLAEGNQNWMDAVQEDGRIYYQILHIGTVTHRCAHFHPNLGQVPTFGKPWGPECRALFMPRPGWKAVGADASGLELRCLANRMNDPAYTEVLLDGDIHTRNKQAWEVDSRSLGKTLTYACLYGSGDANLGRLLGGGAKEGKAARARFMGNLPALARCVKNVKAAATRGFLKGIDGRHIPVRNQYSALNTLLQSDGAVAMKRSTIRAEELADSAGLTADDFGMVGHIHDEMQYEASPEAAPVLAELLPKSFAMAGEDLNFNLPLDGEAKIGKNWSETH